MKPSMSCEDFRTEMDAVLAETLEPEQVPAFQAHKESCKECSELYEKAHNLLLSFSALSSPLPGPHVIENLERSFETPFAPQNALRPRAGDEPERILLSAGPIWGRDRE